MGNLANIVLPTWARYVAYALLIAVVWGHGYTKGIEHVYKSQSTATEKLVFVQGKVTTKIITKYIKQKENQEVVDNKIKEEGNGYAIKFPNDTYHFNNEYVRVFDESVTGVSTLPSRESGNPSSVTVPQQLDVSINNNKVARYWKERAETCEAWTQQQEKESVK